jgi:hypothetical protein
MDPNEITSSGMHPFGRIFAAPSDDKPAASVSLWQVLYNPAAGPGNVMFFQSPELTGGAVRIYTDNAALARWVQDEIPLDAKDADSPVIDATFSSEGDVNSSLTVKVDGGDDHLVLQWGEFMPGFASVHTPDPERLGGHGHYAVYVPARQLEVSLNGASVSGSPKPQPFGDWQGTSAFVVLGETWMRPAR